MPQPTDPGHHTESRLNTKRGGDRVRFRKGREAGGGRRRQAVGGSKQKAQAGFRLLPTAYCLLRPAAVLLADEL
jgi:hypothetical protein